MEETTYQPAPSHLEKPKRRFPKKLLVLMLALILIGLLLFMGFRYFGSSEDSDSNTGSIAPTAIIEPTSEITQEPTPDEDVTPTDKPSEESDSEELDRGDITVEVLNGSGESGVAGEMSDFLKDLGYTVSSTGNADNFEYEDVEIQVKSSSKEFLDILEEDISKSYKVSETSSNLTNSSYDAVIIVGK